MGQGRLHVFCSLLDSEPSRPQRQRSSRYFNGRTGESPVLFGFSGNWGGRPDWDLSSDKHSPLDSARKRSLTKHTRRLSHPESSIRHHGCWKPSRGCRKALHLCRKLLHGSSSSTRSENKIVRSEEVRTTERTLKTWRVLSSFNLQAAILPLSPLARTSGEK